MSIWIYIIVGLSILVFIVLKLLKKAAGRPVLKVEIGVSGALNYEIQFQVLNQELKEQIEQLRMLLHLTSKVLYIIDHHYHMHLRYEIIDFLKDVANCDMTADDLDSFKGSRAEREINVLESPPTGKAITAQLLYKEMWVRNIWTSVPVAFSQERMAYSVIALTRLTVNKLDDVHREYLRTSLKYMADSYENGADPGKLKTMLNLPNEAFAIALDK